MDVSQTLTNMLTLASDSKKIRQGSFMSSMNQLVDDLANDLEKVKPPWNIKGILTNMLIQEDKARVCHVQHEPTC